MKKKLDKNTIITISFYTGLVIKAVDAAIEFIGGIVLVFISQQWLDKVINFIALPELKEDPQDSIMNYFLSLKDRVSISIQHSVAIYLLLHGGIKLIIIWLLWKRKVWAFIPSLIVLGLLIIYEIYKFAHGATLLLLLLIIIDIAMEVIIVLEYRKLKTEVTEKKI